MYVLGISYSMHDSAVALLKDGQIVHAIEEERIDRIKHSNSFPHKSIKKVLELEEIKINDISYIGFNFKKELVKENMLYEFAMENFPYEYSTFYGMVQWYKTLKENTNRVLTNDYNYKGEILFIDHHLAHAASAYNCSPYDNALVLTMDGTGEKYSLGVWEGKDNNLEFIKGNSYPESLGVLYSIVTYHLGLGLYGEGKTMGLASYGEDRYQDFFNNLILEDDEELFKLNKQYLNYPKGILYINKAFNKKALDIIGSPRKKSDPLEQCHMDLAASLQKALERLILKIINKYLKQMDTKNICLAGGVALNSVLNGKIIKDTSCEKIFIQPAASDSGTAPGVALYIYNNILNKPRTYTMEHVYLGSEYNEKEIKKALEDYNCMYKYYENIEEKTASLIAAGKVVGWYQGKMEFGPRALGNRSILADPRQENMKDIINRKVKHRESFRPFAPSVLEEYYLEYFCLKESKSPFMILVCDVRKDKRSIVPAITHVDGTARLQTVNKKHNKKYWNLINEFKNITNVPIVLNTSFNIKGEPIVCTPEDAIKCFSNTKIDYLVLNNYLVEKENNKSIKKAPTASQSGTKQNNSKIKKWYDKNKYYPWYIVAGLKNKLKFKEKNEYDKNGGYYEKL